ncbi:MAG: hypothetical protein JNK82_21915, partial [Myxococcaceae bacterium]|nr:hypothetical protein [Myxococcaceae bacterium]
MSAAATPWGLVRVSGLLLTVACAHGSHGGSSSWYGDLPELAREVAAVRQVARLREFETVALPDDAFATKYLESTRSHRERLSRELERNMVTFRGGAPFTISPEALRGAEATVTIATLAFYEPVEHRLYLREVIPHE